MIAGPASLGASAHVFVADLDVPVLDGRDRHHLERVLRLRSGEAITVSDGRGRWRPARFGPAIEPDGEIVSEPEPEPRLTVGFALVKGERPEWIVQKLTELGVDEIALLAAERCVVHWDDAQWTRHLGRLERIATEAAMQSRRTRLAQVRHGALEELAARQGVALADPSGGPMSSTTTTVLVGPEGGWTDRERSLGATVRISGQILRTETAAVTAGALLTALRDGFVVPRA